MKQYEAARGEEGGGGGGGGYSVRFRIGMLLTARRLERRNATRVKKGGLNYTFCPILMKNRGRNTTFSSFLLKYRGQNTTFSSFFAKI